MAAVPTHTLALARLPPGHSRPDGVNASGDLVLEQPVADRADLLLVAPAPSAERHLEELLEVLAAVDPARRAEQRLGELDGPDLEVADAVAVERRRREVVDDCAVVVEERGDLRALRRGCDRVE